ncbi:MAG: DUF342 domain-containing protein [Candidatus Cloacimonetes bacterium]|nr:DUF342 domain-containing protein [Candidatus Cloacimonadota bacterium]
MSEEDDRFLELQNLLADAGLIENSDKIELNSSEFEELDEENAVISKPRKKKKVKPAKKAISSADTMPSIDDMIAGMPDDDEDDVDDIYEQQINHGEGLEKAKVNLSFSEDLMEAYMHVEPEENYPLDRRFFKRFFLFRGLRYGIDWEAVDSVIESSNQMMLVDQEIIARGTAVKLGRPAQILKYFEEVKTFKFVEASAEEKKDYYKKHRINMVNKGLLLAEKLTAIPGVDGINVKGEVIPSLSSKDVIFKAGKGCKQVGSQIFAEIDGRPAIDDTGRIEVVPLYTVYGDVDLSVGNLDFNGNIEIMGDVMAGITIKAGGSIFVKGSVESSILNAEEDITINGSLTDPTAKGLIQAKGNCKLSHCNSANIEVGGNLYVDKELINSTVFVAGNLSFNKSRGAIVGGRISVGKDVDLYSLGSNFGVTTILNVGRGEVIRRKLVHVIQRVEDFFNQLRVVRQAKKKFQSEDGTSTMSELKRAQLGKAISNNESRLTKALLNEREEKEELERQLGSFSAHFVKIRNKIHAGVRMSIGGCQLNIEKRDGRVEYYEDVKTKKIKNRPLSEG